MALLRRHKSRKQQALDLFATYVKLKAAKNVANGARTAAKGTGVYKVAKKTPIVPAVPVVAGAGIAALLAGKKLKGRSGRPDVPAAA
jgi:hypothetical protein